VNRGHECILAEAFHITNDPLPPTVEFNVTTDRHVAQRNITLLRANQMGTFTFNFNIVNSIRTARKFAVFIDIGTASQLRPLLPTFGRDFELPELHGKLVAARFVEDPCPVPEQFEGNNEPKFEVEIEGKRKINRTIIGRVEGGPTLVHILQKDGGRIVGGLSLLVMPSESKSGSATVK